MKPTLEEARQDLQRTIEDLDVLRNILLACEFLAVREDVDAFYYAAVGRKVESDIERGLDAEAKINKYIEKLTKET